MLLRPIWQYGCAKWGSASATQTLKIQRFQNWVLRLITDAPWNGRDDTLHTDLNMTDIATTIDISYTKLHITMRNHANLLLKDAAQNLPPLRIATRLKRKQHTDNLEPTDE